jgi:HD-GYP domain-containing protein (c-di-GMP phosphodiesterase class II)
MALEGLDLESLASEIASDSGQRFDPHVVNALIQSFRKGRLPTKEEITST